MGAGAAAAGNFSKTSTRPSNLESAALKSSITEENINIVSFKPRENSLREFSLLLATLTTNYDPFQLSTSVIFIRIFPAPHCLGIKMNAQTFV